MGDLSWSPNLPLALFRRWPEHQMRHRTDEIRARPRNLGGHFAELPPECPHRGARQRGFPTTGRSSFTEYAAHAAFMLPMSGMPPASLGIGHRSGNGGRRWGSTADRAARRSGSSDLAGVRFISIASPQMQLVALCRSRNPADPQ